jgi:hypothetical protein
LSPRRSRIANSNEHPQGAAIQRRLCLTFFNAATGKKAAMSPKIDV